MLSLLLSEVVSAVGRRNQKCEVFKVSSLILKNYSGHLLDTITAARILPSW